MPRNSDKTTKDNAANDLRRETPEAASTAIIAAAESGDYVIETLYLAEMFAERLYDEGVARLDQSLSRKTIGASAFFGFKMFVPELLRKFEEEVTRWLREAPDAPARKDLTAALDQITTRLRIMGTAHEHAKRLTWRAQAGEKLLAAKIEAVRASPHMALVIRGAGDEVIEAMVRLGTASAPAAERRRLFHHDVARIAIETLIETDPEATLDVLQNGGLDDLLPSASKTGDEFGDELGDKSGDELGGEAGENTRGGLSLKASLLAYARDAAETHAADTAWLAEEAGREAAMTAFRVAFDAVSAHRRAIAEDRARLLDIEADGQAGILDGHEVRQLAAELKAAQTNRRARLTRVHAVAKVLSAAMITDEPVVPSARQKVAADHPWGQLIDEYYDDLFLPYLTQSSSRAAEAVNMAAAGASNPAAAEAVNMAGMVDRHMDLTARLIRTAGHVPATLARAVMRSFNGGPPEAQAVLVRFIRGLLADKGARAALAAAIPPDVLVRAIAMAPDAEGEAIGISAEEMMRRGHARLRMLRAHTEQGRRRRVVPPRERVGPAGPAGARRPLDLRGRIRRPADGDFRGPVLAGRLPGDLSPADLADLAERGRGGDSSVGHVAPGSVVLPVRLQNPALEAVIRAAFTDQGMRLGPARVGGGDDATRPDTGAADFTPASSTSE